MFIRAPALLINNADTKGAAVIAQRAADIATRGAQPHIYQPLNMTNSCGDHCDTWAAKENDLNTQWQMVYPEQENTCMVFWYQRHDLTAAVEASRCGQRRW